jgi:hypothetical protein
MLFHDVKTETGICQLLGKYFIIRLLERKENSMRPTVLSDETRDRLISALRKEGQCEGMSEEEIFSSLDQIVIESNGLIHIRFKPGYVFSC